jgi:biotin carboxyl carrier protein
LSDSILHAKARETEDGGATREVLAPAVGLYRSAPPRGVFLPSGGPAGILWSLNRRFQLVLGEGIQGFVVEVLARDRVTPVEYGTPLFRLRPDAGAGETPRENAADEAELRDLNLLAVRSPTDGSFYRRPGPDAPAFVEVGQIVEEGATLGLVEIMKCFSPISYGGIGLPSRAEIVRIEAEDATEIASGQILFLVRSAT